MSDNSSAFLERTAIDTRQQCNDFVLLENASSLYRFHLKGFISERATEILRNEKPYYRASERW